MVLVAGAGYWYWTQEPQDPSGELTHTPKMDTKSKGKSSKRARWSKALAKKSSAKKKAKERSKPAAKAEANRPKKDGAKKDSSNKAFAGLKASSLAEGQKPAKPAASKKNAPIAPPKPASQAGGKAANKSSLLAEKANSSKGMDSVKEGAVSGFSIPRIALSSGVEKREPTALRKSFANGSRVHLFMEARNLSDNEQTLVVHWHDPALADPVSVPLTVPAKAPRYRTWANSSPIKRPGAHEVSVQIKDGPEIYRSSFEVLAAQASAAHKADGRSAR